MNDRLIPYDVYNDNVLLQIRLVYSTQLSVKYVNCDIRVIQIYFLSIYIFYY